MDINEPTPWYQQPGPTLAAGVALLALCAVFAYLFIVEQLLVARPAGLVTGALGIYFTYGALQSRKERESA